MSELCRVMVQRCRRLISATPITTALSTLSPMVIFNVRESCSSGGMTTYATVITNQTPNNTRASQRSLTGGWAIYAVLASPLSAFPCPSLDGGTAGRKGEGPAVGPALFAGVVRVNYNSPANARCNTA